MKKLITRVSLASAIVIGGVPAIAHEGCCQGTAQASTSTAQSVSAKYTCPMHPEVISDKPGKCPKCGMNLVPVKEPAAPKK